MSSTRSWPEVASGSVAAAPAWGRNAAAATTPATAARRDLDMVREPLTYRPRIASAIRRGRPRLGRARPPGPGFGGIWAAPALVALVSRPGRLVGAQVVSDGTERMGDQTHPALDRDQRRRVRFLRRRVAIVEFRDHGVAIRHVTGLVVCDRVVVRARFVCG